METDTLFTNSTIHLNECVNKSLQWDFTPSGEFSESEFQQYNNIWVSLSVWSECEISVIIWVGL